MCSTKQHITNVNANEHIIRPNVMIFNVDVNIPIINKTKPKLKLLITIVYAGLYLF